MNTLTQTESSRQLQELWDKAEFLWGHWASEPTSESAKEATDAHAAAESAREAHNAAYPAF